MEKTGRTLHEPVVLIPLPKRFESAAFKSALERARQNLLAWGPESTPPEPPTTVQATSK